MNYITFCHNDFSPRNIFVEKGSVEVIDFVGAEKEFPGEYINFFGNYILNASFNLLYPYRLKNKIIAYFRKEYEIGKGIQ